MNIKQKMIEAMSNAHQRWLAGDVGDPLDPSGYMLNAALDVLLDPENWDEGVQSAADNAFCSTPYSLEQDEFIAVINHIKEQKA